ncbi:TetR family transcriptional regulator [Jiella sp. MQZ9-1]|uniref:TetR family transcriptional regulator n=1 Tax=Jiella flava TaxID=2816857 RepID=A0A939G177_9HYPH|nr:TetR/AcrR family transcriptional regulator [Jiella flava]MBO0664486.1 TetR family transcriptional regulator [Jiella flava]MCD2473122.1 TetR family transcriptional regulator [Jiella flava]
MNTTTTILGREGGGETRRHILEAARPIVGGRGFSAVGLNEILLAAGVPKGSFYHYFASKEAFGVALIETYFERYFAALDALLARRDVSGAERLMIYWRRWLELQCAEDPEGWCLAVKLGAEVSDLSEAMRGALERGTHQVVDRLAAAIEAGIADGSIGRSGGVGTAGRGGAPDQPPRETAAALYQMWLGASLLAKISRSRAPLETALAETARRLAVSPKRPVPIEV